MGTCNTGFLSYGIVISQPQALALLNALRSIPPVPGDSNIWSTDKNDYAKKWENDHGEELERRVRSQVVGLGFEYEELRLETLGRYDEWEGLAVFFIGMYDKEEEDYDHGLIVEFWGRNEGMTRVKHIVSKPWEDEEFIASAKQAFTRLAELPSFKQADVEVDPDWLVGIRVS